MSANRKALVALGGIAMVLLLGALFDGHGVLAAGLSAAVACTALPLGCLLWAALLPLIGGSWRAALGPSLLLGMASLPWALLGLVILLPAAWLLYPWAAQGAEGFRGAWLHPVSFVARLLIYAALWWWLARSVRAGASQAGAGLGVILLVLSLSSAGIDWLMSLDSELASTVFGLFYVVRALLMALAWVGLTAPPGNQRLLRGLLLATCIFWLYLHFMQYLIVWAGNLPREIQWYLERTAAGGATGWGALGLLLILTQAVLPLLLLAFPWGKRPTALRRACVLTLLSGFIETSWLGLPSVQPAPSLWLPLAWVAWAGAIAWLTYWRRPHEA